MVKITERDLAIIAGLAGTADFLTEGRFSAPVARSLKRIFRKTAPVAARGAAAFVPRAVGTARFVAMRHPYVAAGAAIYVGIQEREKIRALLDQGYDIVEPAVEPLLEQTAPGRQELFETMQPRAAPLPGIIEQFRPKPRKPSTFNKAIKAGMLAVKKDKAYGGKGKISPAKKVFSVVVKLAAAKKKKKKAPKSGIRRRIWNAMKGLR
jgi:hypothetical protein